MLKQIINKKTKCKAVGVINKIDYFAVHDGPGIRALIYFQGCPLNCKWCCNPETQNPITELIIPADLDSFCKTCGLCKIVCTRKALDFKDNKIVIDRKVCDFCGECSNICPKNKIEVFGKLISVEEILSDLRKSKPYYENSGGGVTISGGEPLYQPDFLIQLTRALKKENYNVAVGSSGYFDDEDKLVEIANNVDIFFMDFKVMDSELHKQLVGQDNILILRNARILMDIVPNFIVRVPSIKDVNINKKNADMMLEFFKKYGKPSKIQFLRYHTYGSFKYKLMGKKYEGEEFSPAEEKDLIKLKNFFEKNGIEVQIAGIG